jgi:hypothetical protein
MDGNRVLAGSALFLALACSAAGRIDVQSCPDGGAGGSSGDGGTTCVDVSWSNATYCR